MDLGQAVWAAMRTSEFWVMIVQAVMAASSLPVPEEFKTVGWLYVAFRVLSKVVQYVIPNPENPERGWFKKD